MSRTRTGRAQNARFIGTSPFGERAAVSRYTLQNGLTLLILVDRTAPVISYHSWFRVGSADEEQGKTGLAHFFEHLMFNETTNRSQGEFDSVLESVGAENNAATWTDWTMYYETFPKKALPLVVELEADRMRNLVVREKQVNSEREVVMNERRMRVEDDVEGYASERLYALAFKKHSYRWPTIGWMRDIKRYSVHDCQAFYNRFYAPNNVTVVVAGDVDEEHVVQLVNKAYGRISPATVRRPKRVIEPVQRSERRETVRLQSSSERLVLGYKSPAMHHPDNVALSVISDLLFSGSSSRLVHRLVNETELCTSAYGSVSPFEDTGLFSAWLSMRPGVAAKKAEKIVNEEFRRLQREKPSEAELEKVVNRTELAFFQSIDSISARAEQIGFYETVLRDPNHAFARVNQCRELRPETVREVASRYLNADQRTVIHVVPESRS
ncbi:MAG: pitrilysin family protein [Polyangiales bacterium]